MDRLDATSMIERVVFAQEEKLKAPLLIPSLPLVGHQGDIATQKNPAQNDHIARPHTNLLWVPNY